MRPFQWTDRAVRRALGLDEADGPTDRVYTGVSTDTRSLQPGDLFVALKGDRFDGHRFLDEAAEGGGGAAVVSQTSAGTAPLPIYPVVDTLVALGQLARFRRRALGARVVALTGSSGKTTLKELLSSALRTRFRVHATMGNLNNRVGLPLTLLACPDDADAVVVELGTNEPGEIGILTRIAEPDLGVVTTVSETHLEGLLSLEGVLKEKLSLLSELKPGAPSLVGDLPPILPRAARAVRDDVRVAGFTEDSDELLRGRPEPADAEGRVAFAFQGHRVHPRLPGRHGAMNALLALAVTRLMKLPLEETVPAVEAVPAPKLRGEVRRVGGLTLLLDCYNANPQSVRAALEWLASLPAPGGRVAVLGSMLELGDTRDELHLRVLDEALALPLDLVVCVGTFAAVAEGASGYRDERVVLAPSVDDAWDLLSERLSGDEIVLLKASRGLALEALVPHLEATFGREEKEGG
jgi:UDP-N-acetylmuramoyl-tripeptide--D-alanyl-D-alanine ligase